MPQRDDLVYVSDMVEYGAYACEFVEGREASDLFVDRQLAFSLVRALTVFGEAAAQVSREWRVEHAEIPWREIVGMRNILVHRCTLVDYQLLGRSPQNSFHPSSSSCALSSSRRLMNEPQQLAGRPRAAPRH